MKTSLEKGEKLRVFQRKTTKPVRATIRLSQSIVTILDAVEKSSPSYNRTAVIEMCIQNQILQIANRMKLIKEFANHPEMIGELLMDVEKYQDSTQPSPSVIDATMRTIS